MPSARVYSVVVKCPLGRHKCPCSGSLESTVERSNARCLQWRDSDASKMSMKLNIGQRLNFYTCAVKTEEIKIET